MKFRLQSVLNYREQRVEQRQAELAAAERARQAQMAALQVVRAQLAGVTARIQATQAAGRLDCGVIMAQYAYRQGLQEQAEEAAAALAELSEQVRRRREELAQAMQEKQVLEKLKARHQARVRQEEQQREGKTLDEIGVIRFRSAPGTGESS